MARHATLRKHAHDSWVRHSAGTNFPEYIQPQLCSRAAGQLWKATAQVPGFGEGLRDCVVSSLETHYCKKKLFLSPCMNKAEKKTGKHSLEGTVARPVQSGCAVLDLC